VFMMRRACLAFGDSASLAKAGKAIIMNNVNSKYSLFFIAAAKVGKLFVIALNFAYLCIQY